MTNLNHLNNDEIEIDMALAEDVLVVLSTDLEDYINGDYKKEYYREEAYNKAKAYIKQFNIEIVKIINEAIKEGKEDSLKFSGLVNLSINMLQKTPKYHLMDKSLDISTAIAIKATTESPTILDYDQVCSKAVNEIETQVKEIYKKTNCNKDTLNHIIILFYNAAIYKIYSYYHRAEVEKINNEKNINANLLDKLLVDYQQAAGAARVILDNEIREVEEKLKEIEQKLLDKWYKADKFKELRNRILNKFYPGEKVVEIENPLPTIPHTRYPEQYVIPKDKVTNKLFEGELSEETISLRMESDDSNIELTAKVSIDFDDLENVKINNKNIIPYDREVHDAIVSLYIDGGNKYMTPLMIYRTMTCNPNAKTTDVIENAISESVTRLSSTRVTIDTTEEVKAYKNMDKVLYQGNLLYSKQIIATHKGKVSEWIKIIDPPILYQYANSKNQVARVDVKLLNTPINKNEESIVLQGYLHRRILAMPEMKKSKKKSWNVILYNTIYNYLEIEAKTDVALRDKQRRVRDQAHRILDYWVEIGYIKDYIKEPKGRQKYYRLIIVL